MTKIDYITQPDLMKAIGITNRQTLSYYIAKGVLVEGTHFIRESKTRIIYLKSAVKKLKEWRNGKRDKGRK